MRISNHSHRFAVILLLLCQGQSMLGDGKTPKFASRAERFPSIEERVKLYMSNWYVPPCKGSSDAHIRYTYQRKNDTQEWPTVHVQNVPNRSDSTAILQVESIVEPDMLFYLDRETVMNCANLTDEKATTSQLTPARIAKVSERIKFRSNMRMYCFDVATSMLTALDHFRWEELVKAQSNAKPTIPTLLQFGDNRDSHVFGEVNVPHMKKFRSASVSAAELARVTSGDCHSAARDSLLTVHSEPGSERMQPIVWKLATHRHFDKLNEVRDADTPWQKKKDMAVFLGQLTGSRRGYVRKMSDEQNCQNLIRCRLVYNHANSTLIHAKLTSTRGRLPDVLNGVELISKKQDLNVLLEFKGIIMIEGNDVASGLKWALLSQSVVLMPPPKHTSWAMEELLEPWVHYIPLDPNATNVEERMQWVVDHDVEAKRISERGTRWMEDLVFHPDAEEDDRIIQEEIMRRYHAHFKALE